MHARIQMAWFLIICLLVLSWVASLCKLLLVSRSNPRASSFNSSRIQACKNVLLVIAHPDDESMFFAPTINYLVSMGFDIHVLCISTGNADGLGNLRKEELYMASAVLKIPRKHVMVLDHPDLQDGFGNLWDSNILAKIIEDVVRDNAIDVIITFDNYGISGHCNHRDVHMGVRKLLQNTPLSIEAWELVSTNLLRKYSGPIDIWLSIFHARRSSSGSVQVILNENPIKCFAAMAQHRSQYVWFRKFFVSFSGYTYVNMLKMIKD